MRVPEDLGRHIEQARARARELERQVATPELEEALAELDTLIEELSVAEEELRAQNEQLQSAQAWAEAEQARYRELFESAPDGYVATDNEGTVREANRAAGGLLRTAPEGLVGQPMVLFAVPDQTLRLRNAVEQAVSRGTREEVEVRLRPPGGEAFEALVTIAPVTRTPGSVTGLRWMLRDITERKRAEEELRALNAKLERRVAARTADLEAAARAKDNFLATLAHELRNPLASMRNAVLLLRTPGVAADRRRHAEEVLERQIEHQARLLDDLLNVSRIARGRISLSPERLDLTSLVRQCIANWFDALATAGLRVHQELPDEPLWVDGDPTRLSQVMDNLLHNACKFTPAGGEVRVQVLRRPAEGHVAVCVQDTGVGISETLIPHLFESFSQAEAGLGRAIGGLGLGLALVKGLIELHGGRVEAASGGHGKGSRFCFTLPLAVAPAPEPSPVLVSDRPAPCRILIVDDNRDMAQTLRDLLELEGHTVEVAHTGPEAVSAARQTLPDVVLCDIGLPGMDGYAVARHLRSDPALAGTRLVALSGYGQEEHRQRAREAGFDVHLVKPVDLPDLHRAFATGDGGPGHTHGPAPPPASTPAPSE